MKYVPFSIFCCRAIRCTFPAHIKSLLRCAHTMDERACVSQLMNTQLHPVPDFDLREFSAHSAGQKCYARRRSTAIFRSISFLVVDPLTNWPACVKTRAATTSKFDVQQSLFCSFTVLCFRYFRFIQTDRCVNSKYIPTICPNIDFCLILLRHTSYILVDSACGYKKKNAHAQFCTEMCCKTFCEAVRGGA